MSWASGLDPTAEDFESRFYDAGCDDAGVGFQKGRIIVDFSRKASSVEDAIASAVANVRAAGATVEHVEPDPLVNLTDIAERTGLSRAAVSQYAKDKRLGNFPLPVARVTTTAPLYEWAQVAAWLYHHDRLPKEAVIEALAVKAANSLFTATHFGVALKEKLKAEEALLEAAE
jgi:transcriptional regulator with XRE-family HTH domain